MTETIRDFTNYNRHFQSSGTRVKSPFHDAMNNSKSNMLSLKNIQSIKHFEISFARYMPK